MKPITPGEILFEDYMKPLALSQNRLGRELGVSPRAINEIVHGKRSITAEMSIRLGAFFSQSPRFWLNIQTECDLRKALQKKPTLVRGIQPLKTVADSFGKYG